MTPLLHSRTFSTPWFPTPGAIEPNTHLFVIGDVNGHADAFEVLLDTIARTSRKAEQSVLLLLGNVVGPNPDSYSALDLAIEARKRSGTDMIVSLPGSHEIMLAEAVLEPEFMLDSWMLTNGQDIVAEYDPHSSRFTQEMHIEILRASLPHEWAESLLSATGWWACGDALFVHAGVDPRAKILPFLNQHPLASSKNHWAWINEPFLSWDQGWGDMGFEYIVHGHSPAVPSWIKSDADMAKLVPLHKGRIQLAAGHPKLPQIIWAELVGDKARVHCHQYGRSDAF